MQMSQHLGYLSMTVKMMNVWLKPYQITMNLQREGEAHHSLLTVVVTASNTIPTVRSMSKVDMQ